MARHAETLEEIRHHELRRAEAISHAELTGRIEITRGAISKLEPVRSGDQLHHVTRRASPPACHTRRMSTWGPTTYGEPCRECGYAWTITLDDALTLVRGIPATYEAALEGATGTERHSDLSWSVGAYVCHVADNLRIWAERLAGVAAGASPEVAAYDENELAAARRYEHIALQAAIWSLRRSVDDWLSAVGEARAAGVVLRHSERGELELLEVVRMVTHDAAHHLWDIRRTLRP